MLALSSHASESDRNEPGRTEPSCEVVEVLMLDWQCSCGCKGRTSIDRIGQSQGCLGCDSKLDLPSPKRSCCICQRPATKAQLFTGFGFCDDPACFEEYERLSGMRSPRIDQLMRTCEH